MNYELPFGYSRWVQTSSVRANEELRIRNDEFPSGTPVGFRPHPPRKLGTFSRGEGLELGDARWGRPHLSAALPPAYKRKSENTNIIFSGSKMPNISFSFQW